MRKPAIDDKPILTTEDPRASTIEYPLPTAATAAVNDKAWSLMYKAIIDGFGRDPKNFQLIYPFTTWDWPIQQRGYTSAAEWDFVSAVPQWSATGAYVSAGTAFNDAYNEMLNVVSAATSDPNLQARIDEARNQLNLAARNYDTIYAQAKDAYKSDSGSTNVPTFTEWLATFGGKSSGINLFSAEVAMKSAQSVYNQLLSETKTPGLDDAQKRMGSEDYYTKFQDPNLETFPLVPGYSIGMDATTWLNKVKSGTGPGGGTVGFSNSDSEYSYKDTWAGGSASVGQAFWAVKVGGSWQRIDEFETDSQLEVRISFKALDQISIDVGRWYNGGFVKSMASGPFIRGYSPYGAGGNKAVWGKDGIISLQKVGMVVCYKPSFTINVSSSSFKGFSEKWQVSSGLRIGPFEISGGGGSTSSGWVANSQTNTFTGETTSESALIMGVNVEIINPPAQRTVNRPSSKKK